MRGADSSSEWLIAAPPRALGEDLRRGGELPVHSQGRGPSKVKGRRGWLLGQRGRGARGSLPVSLLPADWRSCPRLAPRLRRVARSPGGEHPLFSAPTKEKGPFPSGEKRLGHTPSPGEKEGGSTEKRGREDGPPPPGPGDAQARACNSRGASLAPSVSPPVSGSVHLSGLGRASQPAHLLPRCFLTADVDLASRPEVACSPPGHTTGSWEAGKRLWSAVRPRLGTPSQALAPASCPPPRAQHQ